MTRTKLNLLRSAILLACAGPLVLYAEERSTVDKSPVNVTDKSESSAKTFHAIRFEERFKNMEPPTDDQFKAALDFMEHELPTSFDFFRFLPDGARREEAKRQIYGKYTELQQLKDRDPNLYQIKLSQAKLSDEILGLVRDIRRSDSDEDKAAYRAKLKDTVKQRIGLELKERELRIDKINRQLDDLQRQLKEQESKLAEDKNKSESELDRRVEALVKSTEGPRGGPRPYGGRGFGPRGAGPIRPPTSGG